MVFNLASWAAGRRPLEQWLVDELVNAYDVPRRIGQEWVEAEHVLPLLDGLDEVAVEHRDACVQAIDAFRSQHGLVLIAVCSRTAEHAALTSRLRLLGAVEIQPLRRAQVRAHLEQVGEPLSGLHAALEDDPTLWELLTSPLLLSIAALAYRGRSAGAVRAAGTPAQQRHQLFAAYTDAMFERAAAPRYPKPKTVRWLACLAGSLQRRNQSDFHLERINHDWLPSRAQQRIVTVAAASFAGLVMGLLVILVMSRPGSGSLGVWLSLSLSAGLLAGLCYGLGARWAGPSQASNPRTGLAVPGRSTRWGAGSRLPARTARALARPSGLSR